MGKNAPVEGNEQTPQSAVDVLVAEKNPETLKENVQHRTLDELNAFADRMATEKKTLNPEVTEAIRKRAEQLLSKEVDKRLTDLEKYEHLAQLLAAKTTAVPGALPVQNTGILKTISTMVEGIPYIGGFFSKMIPTKIPSLERIWLYIKSSPVLFSAIIPGGAMIRSFFPSFMEDASRRIAELDVQEAIATSHPDAQFAITPEEWEMTGKNQSKKLILIHAKKYLEHAPSHVTTFTLKDIQPDAVAKQSEVLAAATLQQAIEKTFGATMTFGSETKSENGVIQLQKTDFDDVSGTPRAGSAAAALLKAKQSLRSAATITIDPKRNPTLTWNGDKASVTLPQSTQVGLEHLNQLLARRNKFINRVCIDPTTPNPNGLDLSYKEGIGWVLRAPNDDAMLTQLATALPNLDTKSMPISGRQWQYKNSAFVLADTIFRVHAQG